MAELEKEIQNLIDTYRTTSGILDDKIKEVCERWAQFAIDHEIEPATLNNSVTKEINALKEGAKKNGAVNNQKLKVAIETEKMLTIPNLESASKPADYTGRVANALEFLKLQGGDLTDETAFLILKDFIDDYGQMKLFRGVVKKQVEIENAESQLFPKTFAKLTEIEAALNAFDELELFASNLFMYPKLDWESYIFGGYEYPLTRESYEEIQGEESVIRLAKDIDKMAANSMAQ